MKKTHKHYMDKRTSFFFLLIIISACGIYYSLWRKHNAKALLGSAIEAIDETQMQESFKQMEDITVEISGAVLKPGAYSLHAGDTVERLIEMAGGLSEDANTEGIDFSASLFHLQKIEIGKAEVASTSDYSEDLVQLYYPPTKKEETMISEKQKININTANSAQFQKLPGIGPKLADSIVAYREENGEFKTIEDLMNVPKIGEKTFAAFAEYITIGKEEN